MLRFLFAIFLAAVLVACDKPATPNSTPPSTPSAAPSAAPVASTPAKPAMPDLKAAVPGEVKNAVATASEEAKKTVAATEDKAKEVVATAKEATADAPEAVKKAAGDVLAAIPGLEGLTEGSFSVDKLKGLVGNLKPDQLQGIADKLVTAIKDKMGNLGGLADLTKGGTGAADLIKSLKEKLTVVVDKLKASGLDVSKYTSFLN